MQRKPLRVPCATCFYFVRHEDKSLNKKHHLTHSRMLQSLKKTFLCPDRRAVLLPLLPAVRPEDVRKSPLYVFSQDSGLLQLASASFTRKMLSTQLDLGRTKQLPLPQSCSSPSHSNSAYGRISFADTYKVRRDSSKGYASNHTKNTAYTQ